MRARSPFRLRAAILGGLLPALSASPGGFAAAGPPGWEVQFEELHYQVSWAGMNAGKGMFRARPTEEGLELRAQICSTGLVDALHPVRDQIYTSAAIRDGDLIPEYHRLTQIERGKTKETVLDFRGDGPVRFQRLRPEKRNKEKTIPVPAEVRDVLTAIYTIRRLPLEMGVTHRLPLIDGKKVKRLVVPVKGRSKEDGRVLLEVRPYTVESDGEREGGEHWILQLSKEGRIPVRMKLELSFGTLNLRLTGVRHQPRDGDPRRMFCDEEVRMPR